MTQKKLKKPTRRVIPIRPAFAEIPSEETPFISLLAEEQRGIHERTAQKLLTTRELEVYSRRHALFGEGVESYAAIGRDLGITKQDVKQAYQRAARKILGNYKSALAVIKAEIFHERFMARQGKRQAS